VDAARKFHEAFTAFTEALFEAFTLENVLNLAKVTEWIKKAIQMVHESRDILLRFLDVSAGGDRYMITHAVNSTILALAIGDYMKAPPHRLIELGQACLLHEIGMLKLPPELRRSSRTLSAEERKAMSAHTVLGYRILKGFSTPENVALAALEHHERIDGSGYPRALTSPKITEYAMLIAVVCSYDAMLSRRPFKPGTLDGHATIKDLAQKNRKQYDEKVLKALVYTLSVYPVGTAVLLSNLSKGIVMKTDSARPRCPSVLVVIDPDGKKVAEPTLVQVSETDAGITITGVLTAEEAQQVKDLS
jgi:HD-GYP domain-containing protein (c-di-GMP phosphodiesterase class II)